MPCEEAVVKGNVGHSVRVDIVFIASVIEDGEFITKLSEHEDITFSRKHSRTWYPLRQRSQVSVVGMRVASLPVRCDPCVPFSVF